MCGICGIFGPDTNKKHQVEAMMKTLEHRGPDGSGLHDDDCCALGHRRLSIIDLSENGRQPMINEDQSVLAVVNGEIYNYKDLRERLLRSGHRFRSQCDSEVVVHAYEEYGSRRFLTHLHGMFALAVYDVRAAAITLARDPVGKKPLYYYSTADRLVFASEIKALFAAGVPKEVNYDALPSWMTYQYTLGDETMFKGVYKLRAGNAIRKTRTGIVRQPYWSPRVLEDRPARPETDPRELRGLLEESVKLRLQSDRPVGAFLSGGVDSSAVTALYRKFHSGDLHTFTASFDTKSESPHAIKVSRWTQTRFHEVEITPDMVARDLQDIGWHYDEPLGEQAVICNYYLAREAKKYVSVVLAGEGGDELFGGYPWHHYASILGRINKIPYELRQPLSRMIGSDPTSCFYPLHRRLLAVGQPTLGEALLYPTTSMSPISAAWLLKRVEIRRDYREMKYCSYLNHALALDFLNLLPEKFLMKADKGTMAFAVEERLPLLDRKVVEFAFNLSPRLKKDKWVFRKAVEDLLPPEIAWRPKQGFGTPYGHWLHKGPIREMALDRVCSGKFLEQICRLDRLNRLRLTLIRNENIGDRGPMALGVTNVIWGLFALQLWHDVWF